MRCCYLVQGFAELQQLKKLVIFNAADNQITRMPTEVLRNVRTLKALVLNNNSITALDWLPKFPVRASLLSSCRVLVCSPSNPIDALQELNSLVVSHNRITQLVPKTLERLPKLTKISMYVLPIR